MKRILALGALLLLSACFGHRPKEDAGDIPDELEDVPMLAVPHLDLKRYMGRWYMIANIPYFAEMGNKAPYVEYSFRDDGLIDDVLTARDAFDQEPFHKRGLIDVTNKDNNAEGRITFLGPLWQDYAVLYVDEKYQYTVIGHPSRNYCWVFSRTPEMSDDVYGRMLAVLAANRFKTERVQRFAQRPEQQGLPGFQ